MLIAHLHSDLSAPHQQWLAARLPRTTRKLAPSLHLKIAAARSSIARKYSQGDARAKRRCSTTHRDSRSDARLVARRRRQSFAVARALILRALGHATCAQHLDESTRAQKLRVAERQILVVSLSGGVGRRRFARFRSLLLLLRARARVREPSSETADAAAQSQTHVARAARSTTSRSPPPLLRSPQRRRLYETSVRARVVVAAAAVAAAAAAAAVIVVVVFATKTFWRAHFCERSRSFVCCECARFRLLCAHNQLGEAAD